MTLRERLMKAAATVDFSDHVAGNAAFKAAYPDVVFMSSPVSQRNLVKNDNPPTETVADKRVIKMGGTEIQILNIGRGHTGGDLVAYLPQSKVLFMSELMRHVFPALRSAFRMGRDDQEGASDGCLLVCSRPWLRRRYGVDEDRPRWLPRWA